MKKGSLSVVGLGYVGLPLAVLAQEKGWQVTGYDIDAEKVQSINDHITPWPDEELAAGLESYPIAASTSPETVASADVIVIAVPTPVTGKNLPDLKPLESAVEAIRPHLKAGQVLVVESTINPGVMDEVVLPLLRHRSDLKLDADSENGNFYIAHCPERINPGDKKWTVRTIPRVIGGYSNKGVKQAQEFYESVIEAPVTPMQTIREAEAVKILENTFRDINIAFINEIAKSFDKLGIDTIHVIKGASTKPFAFMPHYPGNGVGGHCISVDPYYLIERARQAGFNHKFLRLARSINDSMPAYTIQLLKEGMRKSKLKKNTTTVALLGLSYKKNIADLRNSPALTIKKLLKKAGFKLTIFDPFVSEKSTVPTLEEALTGSSVLMLATDHDSIVQKLTPEFLHQHGVRLVIDGKNALKPKALLEAGILYYGIGRTIHARSSR